MKKLALFSASLFLLASCVTPGEEFNPPVIKTDTASKVSINSAKLNGTLIDEGCLCSSVNRGFILSENKNTLISAGTTINLGNGNKGQISQELEKLKEKTKYYFVTYAANSKHRSYGKIDSFMTRAKFVDSIIIYPHSDWEYKLAGPETNWKTTIGTWTIGKSPFGNTKQTTFDPMGYFNYNTYWKGRSTIYVRKKFNLSDYDLNSIKFHIGVDNAYELYINGVLVSKNSAPYYTKRWEYTGMIPASALKREDNIIALIISDDGDLATFDMQLTGKGR